MWPSALRPLVRRAAATQRKHTLLSYNVCGTAIARSTRLPTSRPTRKARSISQEMTKFCRACFTVNRDRAMYCRGCARRFKDASSPADAPAPPAKEKLRVLHGSASAARVSPAPAAPGPGRSSTARPAPSRANTICSMLMPMGAAALAALVVWHQWSHAGELHPRAVGQAVPTQPQQLPPTSEQPADASTSGTAPAPQETLLALALEHDARQQRESADMLAGDLRILNVGPALDPVAPPLVQAPAATTARSVAVSARPARRPTPKVIDRPVAAAQQTWPSYAFTGPCDRYNPFGEALCKNAPRSARQPAATY